MAKENVGEINQSVELNPNTNVVIGNLAPCRPEGEVYTIDDDTKEAICVCSRKPEGCLVDGKNRIIS